MTLLPVLLFILAILAIVGMVFGIVWVGRVIRRRTTRRWPFVVGAGVLFALAFASVVVPRAGETGIYPALFVISLVGVFVCLATLLDDGPGPSAVHGWAEAHGVTVTPRNSDFIVAYVFEGHRLRLVCGIGGFVAAAALSSGTGIDLRASGWVWLLSGYLVGVVWSESWLTRLPAGTQRLASLAPRRVEEYLPRGMVVAQVVTALASVGLAGFALVGGSHPHLVGGSDPHLVGGFTSQFGDASARSLQHTAVGIAVAATLLVVGVGLLQRRIIGKPQPAAEPDLLVADDAVRASAVHLLSGTSIAIVLLLVGTQLRALAAIGMIADGIDTTGFAICFVGAVTAWRTYGRRAWVVRRENAPPPPPSALKGSWS